MDEFAQLHCHMQYSLLDGVGKAKEWAEIIAELEQPALAITDHGTLAGVIDHYKACKEVGIKPIIGQESYVVKDRFKKEASVGRRDYKHLTMLAMNDVGFANLIKLSSMGWLEGFYYKPRMDWKSIRKYRKGIIFMSACQSGILSRKILDGEPLAAEKLAIKLFESLENLYLEIMPLASKEQRIVNRALFNISKNTGIPLVLTNDCHYPRKDGAILQDALLMLQQRKTIDDEDKFVYSYRDLYPKSRKGVLKAFKISCPKLYRLHKRRLWKAADNTLVIADVCNVKIPLGTPELPTYDISDPEVVMLEQVKTGYRGKLRHLIGTTDRDGYYRKKKEYQKQLKKELLLIREMGLCDYFLMIAEIIAFAKGEGIRVGGARGSIAGSLVAYCLDITDVDPIKFGLLFERFLSRSRTGAGNIPDIDMDFQHDRRDEIKKYLMKRWGKDHVVNVVTYSTMGSKSIVKDVARAYNIPFSESNEATRVIPYGLSINDALKTVPEFASFARRHKRVIKIAKGLEGQIRHLSTHAAGVVVFNERVDKICPLCINARTRDVLTQWNMYDISDRGFLKLDILGLRTLTVLENSVNYVNRKRNGIPLKLEEIELVSRRIFREFQQGHTVGVFQFENPDFQELCRLVKPKTINDLAVINALGRPGAKQTGQNVIYVANRKKRSTGRVKGVLAEILKSTYGAIIFQEQVMEICHRIGGLTLAETNDVRESIKHFKHDVMASFGKKFIGNAIKKIGYSKVKARELWDLIKVHSSYSFNKNHAVAYSIITYKTMYMKVAYPEIYMLCLLRSVEGDEYKTRRYIMECRRLGIIVSSPDLYRSGISYRLYYKNNSVPCILLGFTSIKGIGVKRAQIMIKTRKIFGKDYIANLTEGLKKTLLNGEVKI